ncbi:MAG: hypothetical protein H6631_15985 [Anaerolineaceae bacterium]|nr:hypothetical protein [Anaerolineaceae bacterium]MCB9102066.1 hypothetical protein [Anaerolineales bacterium]
MPSLRFESNSPYDIRLPQPDQPVEVITLGRDVVAREESLPVEDRTPYTAIIGRLVAEAEALRVTRTRSENRRTTASETLKRLDKRLNAMIDQIMATLKANFLTNLEVAQEWGFKVRQTTGNLQKPFPRTKQMAALRVYIDMEQSRPPEEQFTLPPLAEVIALYEEIETSASAKATGRAGRMQSRVELLATVEELRNYIQLALHDIVGKYYKFGLAPGLQEWGFEVFHRQRSDSAGDTASTDSGSATPTDSGVPVSDPTSDGVTVAPNGTAVVEVNGSVK